jgi:predicted phage baseplate assembly protein
MRLPEIVLDDRRFQDLVDEARERIIQRCPEWTEHNVSDPGITLIELFAWMTETTIFRLNRVPEKLHVALLELLGIKLEEPTGATTEIRFRLASPASEESVELPGESEVATVRQLTDEPVVFQTDETFVIPAAQPTAYVVERKGAVKDVGVAKGVAQPKGADQAAFASPPVIGDALYLGFDTSLERLVMQLDVDCSQARGAGVDPEDPPLRWEASGSDGWLEADVLEDRTGGFNYGSGLVELQMPRAHAQTNVGGKRGYWLRCRLDDKTRSGEEAKNTYTHPPEIYSITAAPIGALIGASHAVHEPPELIGESDGTPAQAFRLRFPPILPLDPDETLEITNPETGAWERWERKDSFVESGKDDKHYVCDEASGVIELGPAIREPTGEWRYHGAVPPKGARLRMTGYRHGGGRRGNVAAETLTVPRTSIPGVDTVSNPAPAMGGVDPETLESARQRASMEIRTRYRAVTAEDFEFLSGEASPRVARVRCVSPNGDGVAARVHIIPRVEPADRKLELAELTPDEDLLKRVAEYLDEKRLIGTQVELVPGRLRGVSVVVNVQASPQADLARVEQEVKYALDTYLNPLVGGSLTGPGSGWEFGRALNQGELFGIVHSIDGVEFVKILRVYETDLKTGKQESKPAGTHLPLEPDELIASGNHIVKAEHPEF